MDSFTFFVNFTMIGVIIASMFASATLLQIIDDIGNIDNEFGVAKYAREALYVLCLIITFVSCVTIKTTLVGRTFLRFSYCFFVIVLVCGFVNQYTLTLVGFTSAVRLYIIVSFGFAARESFLRNPRAFENALYWSGLIYILGAVPISLYQLMYFPGVDGTTMFGPRVFGFANHPIIFSQALAAFTLTFVSMSHLNKPKFLILVVAFLLSLLTGGRSGLLSIIAISYLNLLYTLRLSQGEKLFMLCIGVLFSAGVFQIISSEAFSGRRIEEAYNDGRLAVWYEYLTLITSHGLFTFLFGYGLGTGTNALLGISSTYSSDILLADGTSFTIFLSFGMTGVIVTFVGTYILNEHLEPTRRKYIILGIFPLFFSQDLIEIPPANLLCMASVAMSLRSNTELRRRAQNLSNSTLSSLAKNGRLLAHATKPY